MQDDTKASGTGQIKDELVAVLSGLTCVRRIDSFGSVAIGRADQWSDIDLLVSCDVPERTAWLAAGAIRSVKNVAFYRPFTGAAQPSGRYWFYDESPFHRLDVSFHSPEAYAALCRSGVSFGHPVTVRPEYVAQLPADPSADARLYSPAGRVEVNQREAGIGRLLYIYLETAKDHLRGRRAKQDILETRAALFDAVSATPTIAGSPDLLAFLARVDEFIQRIVRPTRDRRRA